MPSGYSGSPSTSTESGHWMLSFPTRAGCADPPVFSFAFAIPPSQVAVDVRAGDDISSEEMIVPKAGKRWLVVQTYDDLPVETSVWTEQPAFG